MTAPAPALDQRDHTRASDGYAGPWPYPVYAVSRPAPTPSEPPRPAPVYAVRQPLPPQPAQQRHRHRMVRADRDPDKLVMISVLLSLAVCGVSAFVLTGRAVVAAVISLWS